MSSVADSATPSGADSTYTSGTGSSAYTSASGTTSSSGGTGTTSSSGGTGTTSSSGGTGTTSSSGTGTTSSSGTGTSSSGTGTSSSGTGTSSSGTGTSTSGGTSTEADETTTDGGETTTDGGETTTDGGEETTTETGVESTTRETLDDGVSPPTTLSSTVEETIDTSGDGEPAQVATDPDTSYEEVADEEKPEGEIEEEIEDESVIEEEYYEDEVEEVDGDGTPAESSVDDDADGEAINDDEKGEDDGSSEAQSRSSEGSTESSGHDESSAAKEARLEGSMSPMPIQQHSPFDDDWKEFDEAIASNTSQQQGGGSSSAGSPRPVDVENQIAPPRQPAPVIPEKQPVKQHQQNRRKKSRWSSGTMLCGCFLLFIVTILVIGILIWQLIDWDQFKDDDEINPSDRGPSAPVAPPTLLPPGEPTLPPVVRPGFPSAPIGGSYTTPLDPSQPGNCNFDGLEQPHVIDQCTCDGSIDIIANDVRSRYDSLRRTFIPRIYSDYTEDIASCTARNQALVWLSTANDFEFDDVERNSRFALAVTYIELSGGLWFVNSNWLSERPSCEWFGVACTNNARTVAELKLDRNNAIGTLPRELNLLYDLNEVTASQNEISGKINQDLFTTLSGLRKVDLSFNRLTGPLPITVSQALALQDLDVEGNVLTGRLSASLGDTSTLTSLNIGMNQFVGEIPISIFNLPQLNELLIHDNKLTGTIPLEIGLATKLTHLNLGPNLFNGNLPEEISQLTNMQYLYIQDLDISGRLMDSYGEKLVKMEQFVLSNTGVEGSIPGVFGQLTNLVSLDLSNNDLRGEVNSTLSNLKNLRYMYLNDNGFTGTIPTSFGDFRLLLELLLHDNLLEGTIPARMGNIIELQKLTLDGNQFRTRVPDSICELRSRQLEEFVVDCPSRTADNDVVGVICGIPTCCSSCRSFNG